MLMKLYITPSKHVRTLCGITLCDIPFTRREEEEFLPGVDVQKRSHFSVVVDMFDCLLGSVSVVG